jgi:hypothetical protein
MGHSAAKPAEGKLEAYPTDDVRLLRTQPPISYRHFDNDRIPFTSSNHVLTSNSPF